jgi:hypothetical protein
VKWTERFIARAQRKSDLRAERFREHEESVRAGTEPPNFMERLESSMTLSEERLRARVRFQLACANERLINANWPQAAPPYQTSLGLADAWRTWVTDRPIRGPDGVAVTIWVEVDDKYLPFHDPPYDQAGVSWHQLAERQKTYAVCVRRTSIRPTRQFPSLTNQTSARRYLRHERPAQQYRLFATETSARWYAVELARAVRQSGITWIRPSDAMPDRSRPARTERILATEIAGGSRGPGHHAHRPSQRARALWRRVRTARR